MKEEWKIEPREEHSLFALFIPLIIVIGITAMLIVEIIR